MLVKRKHYRPVPPGAEIVGQTVRYTCRGKTVTRPLNRRGDRMIIESKKWIIRLKGPDGWIEQVAYTDREASEALQVDLIRRLERGQAGLTDPYGEHRRRPLAGHVADYEAHLDAKGNTSEYIALTVQRVSALLDGIRAERLDEITAGRVQAQLAEWRQVGLSARADSKRKRQPLSVESCNHYIRAIRAFCRWLVSDRRIEANPVAGLGVWHVPKHQQKRLRRALTADELARLIEATERSATTFRGLTGGDRAMLYLVATHTGLRVGELAAVTPGSFDLTATPATVTVTSAYTKNRQEATQPLPAWLSSRLASFLAAREPTQAVWPGTWSLKASAKMLRIDLADAGVEYQDAAGRYVDFHSLRHTYVTNLARAGTHVRNAQALARHSKIDLTMSVYTHTVISDLAADVDRLADPTRKSDGEGRVNVG